MLQNLDAQNLDALPPFLDEVHLGVVLVDAELRHLLRKDYFLDEVGVELRHLLRMDYFQDVAQLVHLVLLALVQLEHHQWAQQLPQQLQQLLLALLHAML